MTKQAVQGWLKTGRFDKKHLPKLAKITNRSLSWWLETPDQPWQHEELLLERAHNLQQFLEANGVDYLEDAGPQALATLLGEPFAYCEHLLSGKVDIDDTMARAMEKKLGMKKGALDIISPSTPEVDDFPMPQRTTVAWPFSTPFTQFSQLSDTDKARIDGYMAAIANGSKTTKHQSGGVAAPEYQEELEALSRKAEEIHEGAQQRYRTANR